MKIFFKLLSVSALFIMSTTVQASNFTIEDASDLLKRSGTVQARYEKVNVALEDSKQTIESSNAVLQHGVSFFLSDISGLSHIDSSGEVLKAMSSVFEKGEVYLPKNAGKIVQNQESIIIAVYQEILDTFSWGRTDKTNFSHALEVTSNEVAALYVARQRLKNAKQIWENFKI